MLSNAIEAPSSQTEVKGANHIEELTWAEVNLDAIAHNVRAIKKHIGSQVEIMAVVKANAYGHGAVPVAQTALQNGSTRLAVYRLIEGIELRQAGITAPVLIMGYTLPSQAETVVRWNLTPTVNEQSQAQALSTAAVNQGRQLSIHVKVDTGLGRFGLLPQEIIPFCQALLKLPNLKLEGFYTHFSVADESSESSQAYTRRQLDIYHQALRALEAQGITVPLHHAARSAALLAFPESRLNIVRPGISIHGLSAFSNGASFIPTQPAMTLKSRVIRLRTLPAGASVGYGRTFITQRPTQVALVPVGYGDGYHRLISNRGQVLIHQQRAPIIGRISMDQVIVDASAIPGLKQHDEVVFFGRQGEATLSVDEVASWAETINYEVTTSLLPRVARVYLRGGKVTAIHRLKGLTPPRTERTEEK